MVLRGVTRQEGVVQLWEVLVAVEPDYRAAKRSGRLLDWLSARLPRCFCWTEDEKDGEGTGRVEIEEPVDWVEQQECFDQNYAALLWLAQWREARRAKRTPAKLSDAVMNTLDAFRLPLAIVSGWPSDVEGTVHLSGIYREFGQFDSIEEFWQVAFASFFWPDLLPWRGSYCNGCGSPLPPTKKKRKASRTKLCSGCRVKKYRAKVKAEAEARRQAKKKSKGGARKVSSTTTNHKGG
jgi:hypothetical protein